MWLGILLLLILFISLLYLIAKDVMNRAALVIVFAVIAYFILISVEGASPAIVVDLLFGTADNDYVNFHTLVLIFGIVIVSSICQRTGLFEFIAFKLIRMAKGDPKKIMINLSILTFGVSAVLADSITAIILIPLTITICRTLQLKAEQFIIIQAIFIKLGATVMPISSVPSILITASQGITFLEYVGTSGLISMAVAAFSIFIFLIVFGKQLPKEKPAGLAFFLEYNAWDFVKNRQMMLIASGTFISMILALIFVPVTILRPDAIAATGAAFLLIMNRSKTGEIIKDIDFELILYLLGIFMITGSMEEVGFIDLLGRGLSNIGVTNIGLAFLLLLWIGAIASAFIDNIPITQLLLSFINVLMGAKGSPAAKTGSLGLALGVIWGDNLSPFGDSILALNIAKAHGVNIEPVKFLKIGLPLTILQLSTISIVIMIIFNPLIGLSLLLICGLVIGVIKFAQKRKKIQK
jgi:Na+/H+ antiporter NhaD/arsenite permease-like protein